jgi:hypothetical protein
MGVLIRRLAFLAGIAGALSPACAFAGGDDYDASADKEGKGPAYFGFVRDTRGSALSDARVELRPKTGEPVLLKSNKLGLYRSHVSKEAHPDEVQVSCEKDGYRQIRVVRRSSDDAANVETNCTMQRL